MTSFRALRRATKVVAGVVTCSDRQVRDERTAILKSKQFTASTQLEGRGGSYYLGNYLLPYLTYSGWLGSLYSTPYSFLNFLPILPGYPCSDAAIVLCQEGAFQKTRYDMIPMNGCCVLRSSADFILSSTSSNHSPSISIYF